VAAVFDVQAPRLDWLRFTTRSVSLIKRGNLRAVGFGVASAGREGVRWNWQVTLPAGHPGWVKDVQTVLENRRKTLRNGKTMARRNPAKKDAHVQLDQSLLDAGTEPTYSAKDHFPPIAFPTRVAGGESLRDTATSDSPFTSLEPEDVTVTVDDRFKYFILYKPDTADAVWVPVAKAEWFWKARAVRSGANWRFPTKEGKVTAKGVTSEFPEYESNVSQNQWIELP